MNVIGSLRVLLGLNTAEFEGDLGKAQAAASAALRRIAAEGRQLDRLGQQGKALGVALTVGLTAPIIAFGAQATRSSLEMAKGMGAVSTLIPGATARVAELKRGVQDLALNSTKSTADLTSGLYEVISAFGDSGDTLKILDLNARAATAGVSTTLEAIKLTSAVTKAYGDTSADAVRHVSDLALLTANLGQTTFPELAASIGRVTPLGKTLNVSQEELFATFATLTGVTGGTAEVSTQLAAVLRGMLAPTDEMSTAIHRLGFASAETMLAQLGLVGSLKAVVGTTDGSAASVGKLFGQAEALNAVFALTGAQAGAFEKNLAAMWKAAGATDQAAKAQSQIDGLGQAITKLQNAFNVGLQQSGDALTPTLVHLADAAAPLVRALGTVVAGFTALPQPVQATVITVLALAAAAGPTVYVLGAMTSGVGQALVGLTSFARFTGVAGRGALSLGGTLGTASAAVHAFGNSVPILTLRLGAAALAARVFGPAMAALNGIAFTLGNSVTVLSVRLWLSSAASAGAAAAKALLARVMVFTSGAASGLLARIAALPIVQAAAAAGSNLLAAAQARLGLAMSAVATAVAVVAVAWASWKVGRWIGETTGATDALGRFAARLMGGQAAVDEYNKNLQSGAFTNKKFGEAAAEAAKRVEDLKGRLSGSTAQQGMAELEQAVRQMASSGQLTADALGRVRSEVEALQAQGAKLTPYLTTVLAPQSAPQLDDDQVKSLRAVRAELGQLLAAQRTTYEAAVVGIKNAIAARVVEAKGVAAITAALFTLQAAQIRAANTDLIRTQLGTVAGDIEQEARAIEKALVAAAMRATGASEQAIEKALLGGAQLTQDLLDRARETGGVTQEQLGAAADKLTELRSRGAELPPVIARITEEWKGAAAGVDVFEAEARKALDQFALLGPAAGTVLEEFERWQASAASRPGGVMGLSERQLETYVNKLRELQAQSRELGDAMPADRAEALGDELARAWRQLEHMRSGPQVLSQNGRAITDATAKTVDWSERLRDLAAAFEVLGIKGDSGIGRLLGGLTAGASAVEKLKQAATRPDAASGLKGFSLGNIVKGPDGKAGFGSIIGGVTSALQGAQAALAVGKAIVGLFKGDPVKKAQKEAGAALGTAISRELAEKIRGTSKELGVSIKTAALLNLGGAISESVAKGGSARAFAGQVNQLVAIATQGGREARKALEEAGKGFQSIADEALKAGVVGDAALRSIIRGARQSGAVVPEIKEFVGQQVEAAVSGIAAVVGKFEGEKLVGGLDLWMGGGADWRAVEGRALENAQALGRRFSATFFAAVNELGPVEAAKKLAEPFERLREQLTTVVGPDQIGALLGPVQRVIDLSNNPMFAGGFEAAAGLKANLEGLANADLLQAQDLVDYGTLAQATVDQIVAGGGTMQEALRAVQPLLASLISASGQYGSELDANTQRLVDQARENGIAFKSDPQQRMVEVLEAIAVKMGAIPEAMTRAAAASAQSFGVIDRAGSSTAAGIGAAFSAVPGTVSVTLGKVAEAGGAALSGLASNTAQAMDKVEQVVVGLGDRSAHAWERVGGASTSVLDAIGARLEVLSRGVVVPIRMDAGGAHLPELRFPDFPEIPRAAKGLYGRKGGSAGYPIIIGDGSGDELVAPVEGALRLAYRVARESGGAPVDNSAVVGELRALREDNRRLRQALEAQAARPVRLYAADGRVMADVVADELGARGHARLERAVRGVVARQRGALP